MSEPASQEEYNAKFNANAYAFGQGLEETSMAMPCPFCAEPDFLKYKLMNTEEDLSKGAVCRHCGRGARAIFTHTEKATLFKLVQTCGPDPAPWLRYVPREDVSTSTSTPQVL